MLHERADTGATWHYGRFWRNTHTTSITQQEMPSYSTGCVTWHDFRVRLVVLPTSLHTYMNLMGVCYDKLHSSLSFFFCCFLETKTMGFSCYRRNFPTMVLQILLFIIQFYDWHCFWWFQFLTFHQIVAN